MSIFEKGQAHNWPSQIIVYTDGASRGNPGPASVGLAFYTIDEEPLYDFAESIGIQTNNYAEYEAVRKALNLAQKNQVQELVLRSDSQLLVCQLNGEYKVKSEHLRPLYLSCLELKSRFKLVKFEHVRREYNTKADQLANLALDRNF